MIFLVLVVLQYCYQSHIDVRAKEEIMELTYIRTWKTVAAVVT